MNNLTDRVGVLDPMGLEAQVHPSGGDGVAMKHAGDVALLLGARLGGGRGEGGGGGPGHVAALDTQNHLPDPTHVHSSSEISDYSFSVLFPLLLDPHEAVLAPLCSPAVL